KTSQMGLLPT
ncbi:hypothetical protein ACMD2_18701, partial [Ananas comosus]